jgi:hypothetical protein
MGIAAVRLLQGVIESDDGEAWEILLDHQSELTTYFARIGLQLVVDVQEGLAYLRQWSDHDRSGGYERLPRLFRKSALGYEATLAAVLLREAYRRFEEEDLDNERCVVSEAELLESWRMFFPANSDEVLLAKRLTAALGRLEKLRLIRRFRAGPRSWEVRRILKARLPLSELETLREQFREEVARRQADSDPQGADSQGADSQGEEPVHDG